MELRSRLKLPTELHSHIISYLSFPENVHLKITCRYFYGLVTFDHAAQISAETSPYAIDKGLYACHSCERLRASHWFADSMLRRKRRRGGFNARKRLYVEYGTRPAGKTAVQRYTPGTHIEIQGVYHVICVRCRQFTLGMTDMHGKRWPFCEPCGLSCGVKPQRTWMEDSDSYSNDSRTWNEREMDMIQTESI